MSVRGAYEPDDDDDDDDSEQVSDPRHPRSLQPESRTAPSEVARGDEPSAES
jgi:hypothetical protein